MKERALPDPRPRPTGASAELTRLLRAEADLERAIADCRSALEEVRRELRGQDTRRLSLVH